jgi:hypothetical protein
MKITFNDAGFNELLTGAYAQGLLDEHTVPMAERANAVPSTTEPAHDKPYYEIDDTSDGKRARRRIYAAGARASAHEAKTNALQRALGGGTASSAVRSSRAAAKPKSTSSKGKARWTSAELSLLVGKGLSNEEIAARTGRSVSAVKAQRYRK